ncbi:DUF5133 domain-containing protein [Streptomyces sp. NPDC057445]|uniref:DUF5133 domain-containing protein n=1 Tax=Streptomyces sp. NPDC057445 TaxID=3346136 RepID=UPI0036D009F5
MLMPDPKTLRSLLARYADLRIAGQSTEETRRALDDVTYTLCVMTATSTIEDALEVADALLAGAGTAAPAASAPAGAGAAPHVDDDEITLVA